MAAPKPFQNLTIGVTPGERIFSEGEIGTTMFIVQSGRVRLFRQTPDGPVEMAQMEKGDFFGEMSLLEAIPRNMSAEALELTELIEINSTTFDRMIRSNIEVAVRMLRKLSGRLQKAESLLGGLRASPEIDRAAFNRADPSAATVIAPPANHAPAEPAAAAGTHGHASVTPASPAAPPVRIEQAPAAAAEGHLVQASAAGSHASARPATAAAGSAAGAHPPASQSVSVSGSAATAGPVEPPSAQRGGVATMVAPPPGTRVAAPQATPGPPVSSTSLSATRPPSPLMNAQRAAQASAAPARAPQASPAAGQGPRLISETGETIFPIISKEALMGRYDPVTETQPEVDLTLIDIKRSVSRCHARITMKDGAYTLTEEVGALNGTFVNGVKLVTGSPVPLKNGDKLSLGTVNLLFRT